MNSKRSLIHVGAGKCGSSALQSLLTHKPILRTTRGNSLGYVNIVKPGSLVLPTESTSKARSMNHGFLNSMPISLIKGIEADKLDCIRASLDSYPYDIVASCEGWFDNFKANGGADFLLDLFGSRTNRHVDVIAFIRPPVKWINSAWWQWGAWEFPGKFDEWIYMAIKGATWIERCIYISQSTAISNYSIMPVRRDVVSQFARFAHLETNQLPATIKRENASLPAEVLRLYQTHRQLRPSAHLSGIDFSILRALRRAETPFQPTPWVLSLEHIDLILSETRSSNLALLDLVTPEDALFIQNDESWWSPDIYKDREFNDPESTPGTTLDLKMSDLCAALAIELHAQSQRLSRFNAELPY